MNHSVTDGSLFLFVSRKRDRIKALWWETGGLTLWYGRLEQGTVELPKTDDDSSHIMIEEQAHSVLELKADHDKIDQFRSAFPVQSAKLE